MPCSFRLLSGLIVLLVGCTAAAAHAQSPTLEPTLASLGPTGHGEQREVTFILSNPTDAPITVTKVKESCSCLSVRFDSAPLAAGASREGTVIVSLGRGFGRFHKKVEFTLESQRSPLTLHITAQFHPGVRTEALEVVLTGHHGGGGPQAEQIYEIISVVPKGPPPDITDVTVLKNPHLTAQLVEPGRDRARLRIALDPAHPEGRVQGEVTALVNGRKIRIPVRGDVFRGIRLEPALLNFNIVRTAEDHVQTIELIPVDDRSFSVIESHFTSRRTPNGPVPAFDVEDRVRDDGGRSLVVSLRTPDGFTGSFGGTLHVTTDHPEKPALEISVFGHVPDPSKSPRPPSAPRKPKGASGTGS